MTAFNSITLAGHVATNPEQKTVNESQLCTFALSYNRNFISKNGKQIKEYFYLDVKAWNKQAEMCLNLEKGDLCIFEGSLKQESWTDKSGSQRSKHVLSLNNIVNITKDQDGQLARSFPKDEAQESKSSLDESTKKMLSDFDDLPF